MGSAAVESMFLLGVHVGDALQDSSVICIDDGREGGVVCCGGIVVGCDGGNERVDGDDELRELGGNVDLPYVGKVRGLRTDVGHLLGNCAKGRDKSRDVGLGSGSGMGHCACGGSGEGTSATRNINNTI